MFLLSAFFSAEAQVNAASCNTSDVQSAINAATEGQTVTIPAGTCTWTNGVTIAGKGIIVNGAGSGRIIAYDTGSLTVATGTLNVAVSGYSPGFSSASFVNGATLKVFELGADTTYMQGTVTGYSGGTLTMNITSTGGSGAAPRWLIATVPSSATIIVNSSSTNPLFRITEDTSVHTSVGNIQFVAGTISQNIFIISYASGGQAVLLHDMWMQGNSSNPGPSSGNATMILDNSPWRGVFWNLSFDGYPFNISTLGAISIQDKANASGNVSWTTTSLWGNTDTTGQGNVYAETNDYHALGYATSTDDQARAVFRYSLYDNSGVGTHGADTSAYGQRYIDVNNDTFLFEGYSNGNTFNLQSWVFIRGGSLAFWGNNITNIQSTDYGTKQTVLMTNYNLQEAGLPQNACWGSGTHTTGEYYHTPRQAGFGYVTGTGTANYPSDGVNNSSTDSVTYVGDSEPIYMWGNNQVPVTNVSVEDYGGSACTNPDTSANYIVSGRDYFNGTTAKPGYTPYTYPNPLAASSQASTGAQGSVRFSGAITIQ
jgi:hypothetical protein